MSDKTNTIPKSKFMIFMAETMGFKFFRAKDMTPLDRWEVFHHYTKDSDKALRSQCGVIAR